MKKLFAIILAACLMASVLCIAASAAGTTVMTVSGQRWNGSVVTLKSFTSLEDGWDYAMEYACDHDWLDENGYSRIVVDLLVDWNSNSDGEFTSDGGDLGFKWGTIRVYDEARLTLNLNGHTINRRLTEWEYNGEVIFVDDDVDLIINGGKDASDPTTGTITGGFSGNGAGGIHVEEDVNITLNNVNLVGNAVENDSGSAIAILDGSKLTMNGGSISRNRATEQALTRGAVYVEQAEATFNNVVFSDNKCEENSIEGAVIYVFHSGDVTLNGCTIENHGLDVGKGNSASSLPKSLIYFDCYYGCNLTMNKCIVRNNAGDGSVIDPMGNMTISDCTFTGNNFPQGIFYFSHSSDRIYDIKNCTFTDNPASVNYFYRYYFDGIKAFFTNCTFNNNGSKSGFSFEGNDDAEIKFTDCDMGNSTYKDKGYLTFNDTSAKNGAASIFTEGSITMIVALLALVVSAASLGFAVVHSKRKTAPAAAESADEK